MSRISNRSLAGLAVLFNLPFAFFQLHRFSYDAYSHIFLADHYRRAWFSLWEPRWYLGFSVAAYPPLVHQLIALLSWPIEHVVRYFAVVGEAHTGAFGYAALETAYLLVVFGVLALIPVVVRSFSGIFAGPAVSARAALLAVAVPAVSLTAWGFGQLPTLFGSLALLLAFARGAAFVRWGRALVLFQAVALAAVAGAAHHGVFLLVPFMGAAVVWRMLAVPHAARGLARRVTALRLALWAALSGLAVAVVLWPFLAWSAGQSIQTPIDHGSRHNLLRDLLSAWFFFIPMYGPLLLAVPVALGAGLRLRRRWLPLLALVLVLGVLGLGGSTGLPERIYGAAWAWLTYDRFALWAALCLLPFAALALLPRRKLAAGETPSLPRRFPNARFVTSFASLVLWASVAAWHSVISQSQPPRLDLAPVINLLSGPEFRNERYFTLGFGDQMARLSALLPNGTPDGNYHTARWLPEQRSSGLGALDGAIWNPQGLVALRPFLAEPWRYGARWALMAHRDYVPLLRATGWHFRWHAGAVAVWEHPGVATRALREPDWAHSPASLWWGTAPILALLSAVGLHGAGRLPAALPNRARVLAGLSALRAGSLYFTLALLMLWWFHPLWLGGITRIFFVYQSALLFAADLATAGTIALWAAECGLRRQRLVWGPRSLAWGGGLLIAAAAVSIPFSDSQPHSTAVAAHLALAGAWYVMLINAPPGRAVLARVLGALLLLQAVAALGQTVAQSNAWIQPANLPWPPLFDAQGTGASVVENAAGGRWLRAYGTLPHPNVLGGFLLVLGGAMAERYLVTGRRRWLFLAAAGSAALVLSFSRAAWLGAGLALMAGAGVWVMRRGGALWQSFGSAWSARPVRLAAASLAAAALAALPLLPWLLVRADLGATASVTEARSLSEREQLTDHALVLMASRPIFGVGAGRFVPASVGLGRPNTVEEPVHNLWLLITAEVGPLGGGAALGLAGGLALGLWRRRRAATAGEAAWGSIFVGLLVIGCFDHYWWTLPPARLLFVTVLGLWAAYAAKKPCSAR